ncbi:MAG: rhodanese-like domain-containing protein [Treponema sp.]|nr:rhodanese-like domain-containing protein [Treponema sp.]
MNMRILYIIIFIAMLLFYFLRTRSGATKISAEELNEKIKSAESCYLLDVRTPQEYAQGHIPTAILLPDYEVKKSAENLIPKKDSFVVVYCRSGARSAGAARTLKSLGYTNVHDLGGIFRWNFDLEK